LSNKPLVYAIGAPVMRLQTNDHIEVTDPNEFTCGGGGFGA